MDQYPTHLICLPDEKRLFGENERMTCGKAYRLDIEVTINENRLLLRVISNTTENRGRQIKFLVVHDVFAKINKLSLNPHSFKVVVEPLRHLHDITTVRRISTYTIKRMFLLGNPAATFVCTWG